MSGLVIVVGFGGCLNESGPESYVCVVEGEPKISYILHYPYLNSLFAPTLFPFFHSWSPGILVEEWGGAQCPPIAGLRCSSFLAHSAALTGASGCPFNV